MRLDTGEVYLQKSFDFFHTDGLIQQVTGSGYGKKRARMLTAGIFGVNRYIAKKRLWFSVSYYEGRMAEKRYEISLRYLPIWSHNQIKQGRSG